MNNVVVIVDDLIDVNFCMVGVDDVVNDVKYFMVDVVIYFMVDGCGYCELFYG